MAKYVVTFADKYDKICDTYEEALEQKGIRSILCAPDAHKKWREEYPAGRTECFVLHNGEPVRAKFIPAGFYIFPGYGNNCKSWFKVDGWLPMDWFRYVQPDDATMEWWQTEDEYGDRDYDDPGPVDAAGNYIL